MASIDKTSLRESVEILKSDFAALDKAGKVSAELQVVFRGLLTIVELMVMLFLERTTKKTSRNSSKPSSQTEKDETSLSKQGSKSKSQPEQDITSPSFRSVENVTVIPVEVCPECGEDLTSTSCHHVERRTTIDIIFEKVTEHVDAEVKECPSCGTFARGSFPSSVPYELQYGDGIRAYVLNLVIAQMVALARVRSMVKTLIGISPFERTHPCC